LKLYFPVCRTRLLTAAAHTFEFWHKTKKRLLAEGEVAGVDDPNVESCLRLETIGKYDPDEDEFEAQTFFSHSPDEPAGRVEIVSKTIKRMIGFSLPPHIEDWIACP